MKICDLFDVEYGINLELVNCQPTTSDDAQGVNFVARTSTNNGVVARVKKIEGKTPHPAGTLTCAGGGSVLSTFVQKEPFYSGRDLYVLTPKRNLSLNQKLYYCMCIQNNAYRYSYGRQANKTLRNIEIPDTIPEWVNKIGISPLTTRNKPIQTSKLSTEQWQEFMLNKIFTLNGGYYNNKPQHTLDGEIPFIGSTENNNGITGFYSLEDIKTSNKTGGIDDSLENKIYSGNCIIVTVDGSVCNAFYQKKDFTCSHSVTALYPIKHQLNAQQALFICTVIMGEKYRWSYGRKPHDVKKFGKSVIKLPILYNSDGTPFIDETYTYSENGYVPDWKFMENYIKSLPYGDRI